jgi:diacylglycerol kinase family enzyme
MSSDVRSACNQLLNGHVNKLDAGVVNGVYFVETLSFGVDAAIALQTMELRAKAGKSSKTLYVQAGIDQILHHRDIQSYSVSFDGAISIKSESLTFAVQVGQYYGGGFKIAPDARLDDGYFDVCIAHPPISLPGALRLFALAKSGRHTNSPRFEIRRAKTIDIGFDGQPPTQADGEAVVGQRFKIQILPHALNVIIPTPA